MATLAGQTLLGRYFLRELVGSGGMADVYLAWDQLRNAKMAVKVLRRDLGTNSRFFDRFANEADILRKLEHPNIVRLFEYEQDDGIAFIVMQWVEGSNLRQVARREGDHAKHGGWVAPGNGSSVPLPPGCRRR